MNNIMISLADPIFWMRRGEMNRLRSIWKARCGNARKNPILNGTDRIRVCSVTQATSNSAMF